MTLEAKVLTPPVDTQVRRGGRATLLAVALASVLLPMTVTGPAVALPELAADLGSSVSAAQWVQNAYGVTFSAFLLAAGGLADRFGRRRIFLVGVAVFVISSAVCALAPSIVVVDIARAAQGIGAAGILTSGAAILAATFAPPMRARAFGVLGASFGCGLALGPAAAGALVQFTNWRAVFAVNVVLGLVVLALIRRVSDSRNPFATRVDWAGLVTFSGALFLLAMVFVAGPAHGWLSARTVGAFAGAGLFLALFVMVELRGGEPMFDLSLFRRPTFVAVVCQPFTITFGFVVLLAYLPPYFAGVADRSTVAAGTLLLPLTLPVLLLPLFAGRLAARVPLRVMLSGSSVLIATGSLGLLVLSPVASWQVLALPLATFGVGVGCAFGVMDNAAVSVVPVERAGMASGIFNTMRITGETVAIAGAGAALSTMTQGWLRDRVGDLDGRAGALAGEASQGRLDPALPGVPLPQRAGVLDALAQSLTSAMHLTFVTLAVLALIGAVATFVAVRDDQLGDGARPRA